MLLLLLLLLLPANAYADPATVGAWVGTAFASAAGTAQAAAWLYAAGMALGYAGTVLVITQGLAAISKALTPRPKFMRGITQEYAGTIEPRKILYGNLRVSGLNAIPPITSGTDGKYLHQVLVLAGHPVHAIDSIYFDQTEIPIASTGAVIGSSTDGAVYEGDYAGVANIRCYTGEQTTVDYILNNDTTVGSNFIGYGLSYLALRFTYDKAVFARTGKPEISAVVRGKLVYDPRLDSTNGGSGTHRYTDDTTWEYSNNPALCLADYLMDDDLGLGEDPARIDWSSVAAAANICDESVTAPTGGSPLTEPQARYTCDILLEATDKYEENIEALCTCMMGHCYYTGGRWYIHAGAWTASAFDLTEDDVVGNVSIKTETPRNDKYNAVRGQYYDADRNYQPSEFQPRTDAAYESADGERIWREVEFRGCTNEYRAQRNATIILKRSRNRRAVTADFGMTAFGIRPFETGTLTLPEIGWSSEPVRCTSWEFMPEGTVRLTLVEESSTDWDDPATEDYDTPGEFTDQTPGTYTPPAPLSLTATAVTGGTLLRWTVDPTIPEGTRVIIRRATSAAADWTSSTIIGRTYGDTYYALLESPATYYYFVQLFSETGSFSDPYPASAPGVEGVYRWVEDSPQDIPFGAAVGVAGNSRVGTPTVSITGGALAVVVSPGDSYYTPANGTNVFVDVITATPSGGTPPYTYSWTDTNSFVTVSSPTAQSSNVTSTGTFQTRVVTITCTVTDAVLDTAQQSVEWTIEHFS